LCVLHRGGLARLDSIGGPRRTGYGSGGEKSAAIKFQG